MEAIVSLADTAQKLLGPLSLLLSAWLGFLVYKATARAPIDAARIAAELAEEASKRNEMERRRLEIFAQLMAARRSVYDAQTVAAFNLIDVIFHNEREVRDAWADLHAAYNDERLNNPQGHANRDEKLRALLFKMAQVLNLETSIRIEDVNRVYTPESLFKQSVIEMHERDRQFNELQEAEAAKSIAPLRLTEGGSPRP